MCIEASLLLFDDLVFLLLLWLVAVVEVPLLDVVVVVVVPGHVLMRSTVVDKRLSNSCNRSCNKIAEESVTVVVLPVVVDDACGTGGVRDRDRAGAIVDFLDSFVWCVWVSPNYPSPPFPSFSAMVAERYR